MSNKKRPRADLLSSLDAMFESAAQFTSSKYTLQAAAEAIGNKQQIYQGLKRKRKDKKRNKGKGNGKDADKPNENDGDKHLKNELRADPLYQKMNVELLAIGLKDCSLKSQVHALQNPRQLRETLQNYLELVTQGTRAGLSAVGSLKNKVLSLDNPFKMTATETTEKAIASTSKKQTAKLLSARRRRQLGLHLLSGEIKYSDAKQLNDIWIRYVSHVIESELCKVEHITDEAQLARNTKLQTKLKYLDLSGCPVEVIQSKRPCNVGLCGIIVAETQHTVQICCRVPLDDDDTSNGSIRTLVKSDSRFKVCISSTRNLLLDGAWLAERGHIFDIYFQSNVESFIPTTKNYTSSPPAKRVIIFTLDGCRVDKLFKVVAGYTNHYDLNTDSSINTTFRHENQIPFLGNVMRHRGSWGVSHNHVPTESRPCHVALTAGIYEDPHAVYENWRQHPVPFDSVFNQSSSAFLYGNRDVVPMLARHAPQAMEEHYTAQEEAKMVRKDTTLLDIWAYDKVEKLFTRGTEVKDLELYNQLHQEKLVIYCHFLGTDVTGPIYGTDSRKYLENIAVVDTLIEKAYKMIEKYYGNDGRTAYVVTVDHGMDLHGNHGNNAPAETRTAIIAWGAGVQGPEMTMTNNLRKSGFDIELPTQSREEVLARLESQVQEEQAATREWGTVLNYKRKDVMQVDVAALISALAGLPFPRNSVGIIPFTYLNKDKYRTKAMRANAQQLYNHALRKEEVKRAHRGLLFVPYSPLYQRIPDLKAHIDEAISSISEGHNNATHDNAHQVVEMLSQEMIEICRNAIVYYQTYDCFFLLGSVVFGYAGWTLVMTVGYLHPDTFRVRRLFTHSIGVKFIALVAAVMWWRYHANSPLTYYLYGLCPLVFWNFVWNHRGQLLAVLPAGQTSWRKSSIQITFLFIFLELVVLGYQRRVMFSLLFVLLALQAILANDEMVKLSGGILSKDWCGRRLVSPSTCLSASYLLIAIFPSVPSECDENTSLVHIGGFMVLAFACITIRSVSTVSAPISQWKAVLLCGVFPVFLALLTLHWTTSYFDRKKLPPYFLVAANWVLAVMPSVWMIIECKCQSNKTVGLHLVKQKDENDLECQQTGRGVVRVAVVRLIRVILALTPALALLSTAYEVLFYLALCSALVSWLMMEAEVCITEGVSITREVQRALMFLLFAQVSFFGTNSVASMTNFQLRSIRRFSPESTPFMASALVILKLSIPFAVVGCAFRLILLLPSRVVSMREKSVWYLRYLLIAMSFVNMIAMQMLFLVKNEGSWKQMGNSIAKFCIINAQIVILPMTFFFAWMYVHDLEFLGKGYYYKTSIEKDEDEKVN